MRNLFAHPIWVYGFCSGACFFFAFRMVDGLPFLPIWDTTFPLVNPAAVFERLLTTGGFGTFESTHTYYSQLLHFGVASVIAGCGVPLGLVFPLQYSLVTVIGLLSANKYMVSLGMGPVWSRISPYILCSFLCVGSFAAFRSMQFPLFFYGLSSIFLCSMLLQKIFDDHTKCQSDWISALVLLPFAVLMGSVAFANIPFGVFSLMVILTLNVNILAAALKDVRLLLFLSVSACSIATINSFWIFELLSADAVEAVAREGNYLDETIATVAAWSSSPKASLENLILGRSYLVQINEFYFALTRVSFVISLWLIPYVFGVAVSHEKHHLSDKRSFEAERNQIMVALAIVFAILVLIIYPGFGEIFGALNLWLFEHFAFWIFRRPMSLVIFIDLIICFCGIFYARSRSVPLRIGWIQSGLLIFGTLLAGLGSLIKTPLYPVSAVSDSFELRRHDPTQVHASLKTYLDLGAELNQLVAEDPGYIINELDAGELEILALQERPHLGFSLLGSVTSAYGLFYPRASGPARDSLQSAYRFLSACDAPFIASQLIELGIRYIVIDEARFVAPSLSRIQVTEVGQVEKCLLYSKEFELLADKGSVRVYKSNSLMPPELECLFLGARILGVYSWPTDSNCYSLVSYVEGPVSTSKHVKLSAGDSDFVVPRSWPILVSVIGVVVAVIVLLLSTLTRIVNRKWH